MAMVRPALRVGAISMGEVETKGVIEMSFKYELNAPAVISCSGEEGTVIARSEYANDGENMYLLRYRRADGGAAETWWAESALNKSGK